MSWGSAGAFERLDGTAYFEIDPRDPLHAAIVNLDKAPRNARGLVEFSSPFYILKPVDMTRWNRKLFYGLNNRGGQIELTALLEPGQPWVAFRDPLGAADLGDGLLLRRGFAYVDAGWHGDGVPAQGRLFASLPTAIRPDGTPVVERARVELQSAKGGFTQPMIGGFKVEPAADLDTLKSTLTVRTRADDPRSPVPSDQWAFGTCPTGRSSLVPSPTDVCIFSGFEPQRIYELVYPARDPVVMGLALVVTRDLASFLRSTLKDDAGNPNPLAISQAEVGLRRAYVAGTSSSAMYLREWLYLGFNEDEAHHKVFDGALLHRPGAFRLFANTAFTHPTFFASQGGHQDFVSTAIPPFTFAVTTDPVTGVTDGILKRPATDPLVMQIDGEIEFWQWQSALNVADGTGRPVAVSPNVRLYFNTGSGHGDVTGLLTAEPERDGACLNLSQGAGGINGTTRALTIALDEWVDRNIEPPKSNFPSASAGSLVPFADYVKLFPKIPGARLPDRPNELHVLDFGPLFGPRGGVQTTLPPSQGPKYAVLYPRPDADGVAMAGVRSVHIRVPLGSNVGWNVRAGAREGELCGNSGSFFPFAVTKAERIASGDPRPSLEERYRDQAGFVAAVSKALVDLVRERLLLPEDADRYLDAARKRVIFPPAAGR